MPVKTYESLSATTQLIAPPGFVLVLKADLEKLEESVGRGQWEDKKWFRSKVGIQNDDLLDKIIFRPFQDELDVENGGFVHYPVNSGDKWMFLKSKTEEWLEENFAKVFAQKGKM